MASKQTIHDKNGNDVYPITLANAIFTKDGEILNSMMLSREEKLFNNLHFMRLNINNLNKLSNRLLPHISANPLLISIKVEAKNIACGLQHSVVLKSDGTVWSCGYDKYGQLGSRPTQVLYEFTKVNDLNNIKQISAGAYHTVVLKDDGTVWTCGYNEYGQLGLGDTTNRDSFTKVNGIDNVKNIACGRVSTYIVKNDGTIWSCGNNEDGQLGLGDTTNRTSFTQITGIDNIKEFYCGNSGSHIFIVKLDGSVWGCGRNDNKQLGLGDFTARSSFTQITGLNNVKQISIGSIHTMILKNDGSVWGCGNNIYGQLGVGEQTNYKDLTQATTNTDNVKKIICGGDHTFLIKNDGTVWGAGYSYYGQLGLNGTISIDTFTPLSANVANVEDIVCSDDHSIKIDTDGSVWGCGLNDAGQIGIENTDVNYYKIFNNCGININDV